MGGIGRNMAKKALVFGMKIRYHNRTRLDHATEKELEAEYVALDHLLAESDVLSLNLPLNVRDRYTAPPAQLSDLFRSGY
jgi:lactate dehydrogenase-like 2-hydroxyacid dehydrogenase